MQRTSRPHVLDRAMCDEDHASWSVLAMGRARVIDETYEIAWAEQLPLRPWAYGGQRPFRVRIDPTEISGRRF